MSLISEATERKCSLEVHHCAQSPRLHFADGRHGVHLSVFPTVVTSSIVEGVKSLFQGDRNNQATTQTRDTVGEGGEMLAIRRAGLAKTAVCAEYGPVTT